MQLNKAHISYWGLFMSIQGTEISASCYRYCIQSLQTNSGRRLPFVVDHMSLQMKTCLYMTKIYFKAAISLLIFWLKE